jgi:hypothetical protein
MDRPVARHIALDILALSRGETQENLNLNHTKCSLKLF